MITYQEYGEALIIDKALIPEAEFPAYAAEAQRLIMAEVKRPVPEKYAGCLTAVMCRLCHQLYIDRQAGITGGQVVKSRSESSGSYSYSESYADGAAVGTELYRQIIRDGLTWCGGEFTGLFYAGIGCERRRCR